MSVCFSFFVCPFAYLGNHEYRGNTQAVIDYSKVSARWNMPDRYYTFAMENDGVTVRFVVNTSGSLSRKVKPVDGTKFCSSDTGFSLISADKKELNLHMINKEGKVIYTVSRKK